MITGIYTGLGNDSTFKYAVREQGALLHLII